MKKNITEFVPLAEEECSSARGAWEAIKGKVRGWSREFSIAKMREERQEKADLLKKLDVDVTLLGGADKNQFLEDKRKLDEIYKREMQRVIFRAKVNSVLKGEKYSKFFHMQIKQNRNLSNVDCVVTDEGTIEDPKEVNNALRRFYKELYTSVSPNPQVKTGSSQSTNFQRVPERA